MHNADRFADIPNSPFVRLTRLLEGTAPGQPPISMAVGEPQHKIPDFVPRIIAAHGAEFARYPLTAGTESYRAAVADWLERRYALPRPLNPATQVLPLAGSREGLFSAVIALTPAHKQGQRPAILLPNPFYQCYAAAALAAGAEPIYVNATQATGYLPDFEAVPENVWARTSSVFMCSPSNPEGAVYGKEDWRRLFARADHHDCLVLADECYSEIYDETPPHGALEVRARMDEALSRVLVFHSLSKRSSLPGLRAGFVAGDAALIARFRELRNLIAPVVPLPLLAAAEACWRDEAHVEENRALYRAKFDLADRVLGNRPGYFRPAGGFFLWLDVGDGERAALRLWQQAGIRVIPGAYLAKETPSPSGPLNPGAAYIRIALVNDLETTKAALLRIAEALS
ncbi:MAG: aminotransferase class I/II-fold pyridoxal phosphate-dependent enzyme [Alphaproteobacteria bacterium]|nr:aminotransferase class I/II-fold pyridoxal phosphate-dependent enzyme [Alphaproteobacteria bacterium]